MNVREAYRVLQENCGIEVGDKVKVLRKAEEFEMGWDTCWRPSMDSMLGRIYIVTSIWGDSGLELDKGYCFPFFVLELVEKAPQFKTITIDGKDIEISIESFNELKKQLQG